MPLGVDDLRIHVVTHIDEAIANGWIVPHYQPVIRTLTGKLCGFEALARWEDPKYGILSPAVFIPALEEAKIIHLLDCCMVRRVCQHFRDCENNGEPLVPVSFNLSRLDFDLCDIFSEVESAAHEYRVPRHMLNIEITESVFGSDSAYMTSMMDVFHNAGYQVWMDDFGSGYSTLNVLKDFDFDELKIDMEFLNRFGEKSKIILSSVVDMAKRLGVQTLAEGVETAEHRDYLRTIGCEKMQGYFFGRPSPYSPEWVAELNRKYGIEVAAERLYLDEIGAVNTLSLSERDLTAGGSVQEYATNMPYALVEFEAGHFRFISANRVFEEGLANIGVESLEEAERRINDQGRQLARRIQRLVDTIEQDEFARLEYVSGDIACVIRAKYVTSRYGKIALIVSMDDAIELGERRRHDRMEDMLTVMYSIYEHVDIIHLDDRFIEPVFGNIGLHAQYEAPLFSDVTVHFAEVEVYQGDRARYLEFMDHDTMIDRIEQSGDVFIAEFFRLRQHGGEYSWKLFELIRLLDAPGNLVMLCIRSSHWTHDGMLQAVFDDYEHGSGTARVDSDLAMTDGSLWNALLGDSHAKLYWKDAEQKYIGASRAFLEYFGFDSIDDIAGKTDDDIGWYINQARVEEDELRILNEGVSVEDAEEQCIVQGEVRDIVENKFPVYRNGRIIGVLGYFFDFVGDERAGEHHGMPTRDAITGVLNYVGLEAATWQYVDAYRRHGVDFAMVSINVDSFQRINDAFGPAFGEKVLKRVGDELTAVAGNARVVGHVYADRFVVLAQHESDDELQKLCDDIEHRLKTISQVDGVPCTVFALAGFARFSELGDVEAMKRYNRDRRQERRDRWAGSDDANDVITSSLL